MAQTAKMAYGNALRAELEMQPASDGMSLDEGDTIKFS
jgi:hypothetical protein